jgi:hypothetical protein
MAVNLSSPITGLAQTGLTSPTYTIVADTSPSGNPGKQNAVTALGGTQTGVDTHSISKPFTINVTRPASYRALPQPNPVTGVVANVPKNATKVITRKGVIPLAGQASQILLIETTISVPAGSDTADPQNIRAALSAHFGALSQVSAGIGDTVINGVL